MTEHAPPDPRAFRAFEYTGWQNVAAGYHDYFAQLTSQAVAPLLDALETQPGTNFLDVATGPGYVAAGAARRGAAVVGMDFSAPMLAQARRQYSGIRFVAADAEELPFPEGGFDVAGTNFGLLHLARPEKGLAEMHRVLRPGGRVAFTVWRPPEEAVGFGIVLRAIETCGNPQAPLPAGPAFFRFSDPAECRRSLLAAGFRQVEVKKVPQAWRLPSRDSLADALLAGTVRMGGLLRAQSPDALRAIRAAIGEALRPYEKDGAVELPMPALLACAEKD